MSIRCRLKLIAPVLFCMALPAISASGLKIEENVKVDKKTCDRVTWIDARGKERSIALVRADGDGKYSGGYVEQYTYFAGETSRTAKSDETMAGVSGMGCAVNHHKGASVSKANSANARTEFIFAGQSHCLWRFRSDYSGMGKTVGLVIDWFIADGRSDILWSVSYDCSKLADKEVSWDARGPYFQFDWDGDGKFFGAQISGIRWGDRYKFKTVNYAGQKSSWDYTEANVIPYMMLYKDTKAGDAEAGVIATVPWEQKDAGGYWWSNKNWGKTGTGMMENWNCPFQLNAYEGYGGEKMAWGTPFGFVGSAKYQALDFKSDRSGYPFQGYSTLIVLDQHSLGTTDATVASVEAAQKTRLTASKGKVATEGAGYAGLSEKKPLATAGWDPVYGVWNAACDGDELQCNFDVSSGALGDPVLCIADYRAAGLPVVMLDGKTLMAEKDYRISLDGKEHRVLITLIRQMKGARNEVQIKPAKA